MGSGLYVHHFLYMEPDFLQSFDHFLPAGKADGPVIDKSDGSGGASGNPGKGDEVFRHFRLHGGTGVFLGQKHKIAGIYIDQLGRVFLF